MDISSLQPAGGSSLTSAPVSSEEAAERRQLVQAAKSVNDSGVLGNHELVFMLDRQTHRAVIRVVDRATQQVVSQIPPDYVLRLAQELGATSSQTISDYADT